MKNQKILSLLMMAIAGLLVFAGSASATTLTSPSGTFVGDGTVLKFQSEGATSLDGTIKITCQKSIVEGEVGTEGVTRKSKNKKITFEECGSNTVTVIEPGTVILHYSLFRGAKLTSHGKRVTALTHNILGTVHCIYVTSSTEIGTLTGSSETGAAATLDIGSAGIPQESTDFGCKDDAVWTGNYKVTTPSFLDVDP
jgi:hypothetical protein